MIAEGIVPPGGKPALVKPAVVPKDPKKPDAGPGPALPAQAVIGEKPGADVHQLQVEGDKIYSSINNQYDGNGKFTDT